MICDECGRPATIRFVETVNGEMRLMRLCGECAAARGIGLSFAPLAGPLVNMLMGFLEEGKDLFEALVEGTEEMGKSLKSVFYRIYHLIYPIMAQKLRS